MSAHRIIYSPGVPSSIQNVFLNLKDPTCREQIMWREVAARAILDALGHTGISEKPYHNRTVREARNWFKFADGNPDALGPIFAFDCADIELSSIYKDIINAKPFLYEETGK